jgi:hypothetical protein
MRNICFPYGIPERAVTFSSGALLTFIEIFEVLGENKPVSTSNREGT